jgi:hypothetical protein
MHSLQHKVVSVIIATVCVYFGFQALDLILGIYQVETYFTVAWYVFAFHVFWLTFIFDLHLKRSGHLAHARVHFKGARILWEALKNRVRHLYHWNYLRHYLNYLILPAVLYWSVIVLMYLNPFHELFKDALIVASTAATAVAYWYLKEAFSHHMELHHSGLKVLSLVKIFTAYLSYTSLIALGWYFGLSLSVMLPVVFIISFLLLYQALFQHRLLRWDVYPAMLMFATLMSLVFAAVFQSWNVNYYTAGLMVGVVYNGAWSILHRYLDRTLNWKILWEYAFMLVVLVSLILATHDFQGRI